MSMNDLTYEESVELSRKVAEARRLFVALCAEVEARGEHPKVPALVLVGQLRRQARVEAGLPALTPYEARMKKIAEKTRKTRKRRR